MYADDCKPYSDILVADSSTLLCKGRIKVYMLQRCSGNDVFFGRMPYLLFSVILTILLLFTMQNDFFMIFSCIKLYIIYLQHINIAKMVITIP